MLNKKKQTAIIIDVREADEVKSGMIENALFFPLSKIEQNPQWLSEFKKQVGDKKIYIYCRSGKRAQKVVDILEKSNIKATNIGGYQKLKEELEKKK